MASLGAPLRRDPFGSETRNYSPSSAKTTPTHLSAPGTSSSDPMDVSQSQASPMGPPTSSPGGGDRSGEQQQGQGQGQGQNDQQSTSNGGSQPTGAAAAAQQPKIVQTAFIHKLYKYVHGFMSTNRPLLTPYKHAGRSEHPTFNLLVQHE